MYDNDNENSENNSEDSDNENKDKSGEPQVHTNIPPLNSQLFNILNFNILNSMQCIEMKIYIAKDIHL